MNSDADDAAAQAIEFWKAIAEEEEYRPDKNMVTALPRACVADGSFE